MGATRADVARLAGVSPAVVSYVLHDGTRPVAPKTRERVLDAIAKLDYRPDPVAQALRGQRTHSVGLLVPDHDNPFYADLQREVEHLAFDDGLVLLVGTTGAGRDRETKYLRAFVDRRVDGLLMMSSQAPDELSLVAAAGMPVVTLDRVQAASGVSTVISNERSGARRAVEHLIECGYRRIGCIAGPGESQGATDRVAGWKEGLEAAGLVAQERLVSRGPFSREGGTSAALALLGDVDALFVSSDVQAAGVVALTHARGIAVPDELGIVSFDGTDLARYSTPALTVVEQPMRAMAEVAMRRLNGLIADPGRTPTHDVLEPRLVVRESTRPRAAAGPEA
ncbi:LacI family DNA-binding transcriptional regulator [Phycicoccus endophyticus]|uniref:LacI family DNA-binding transcriptional regulator n=1 Tax=Phycicoccus endophyticus TaxID=1690220 RepID=A0A7G9R1I9_9MICO|nr:LacI family DNA-binding transcriptional regulator [Phycicoccus endophyticus]NHI18748.1 LacI family transcriptional regulator [Phycicoccus endophyticus]QNN49464.1 LacI family DNA-binding transcriptional regulator [Phycicoccus endophyticus]GGL36818.1 putative HTH-type transcriptional regulator [Phycicoccus endophyticus]